MLTTLGETGGAVTEVPDGEVAGATDAFESFQSAMVCTPPIPLP
jgi:hypothetical protein